MAALLDCYHFLLAGADFADLIADERGALKVQVFRRLAHLFLKLLDELQRLFGRERLIFRLVARFLFRYGANGVGNIANCLVHALRP